MVPERRAGARVRRGFPWRWAARRRRLLLVLLVAIPSLIASGFMSEVLPRQGRTPLEMALVIAFGALFGWISLGFWTALLGFVSLLRRDPHGITRSPERTSDALDPEARVALLVPVCDEPVDRVMAGLEAMRASLEREDALRRFDFFLLSDSRDPARRMDEEAALADWRRRFGARGRLFYRHRRVRRKRKSGNVADFCRRWGRRYRYLLLADADSVMTGRTLVRLVDLMEANPDTALIQTLPRAVNRRSLFGRVQQLASWVQGPVFAAGLHYWQLGDAPYWGHNAIVRVEPFMRHCGLPSLSGPPPWGGEILSHDFVEAALLGRAGHALWLAHDLPGSFEETPSNLLEEMQRDRRWCQGNLQHLRLLGAEGLHPAHRALFLNGALSYVSALLWLVFLGLATTKAIADVVQEPDYFPSGAGLFPEWPVWRPDFAIALAAVTGMVLFLPKILGVLHVLLREPERARPYGGVLRLGASTLLEILLSALLAPVRMLFHTKFVLWNLAGRTVAWNAPARSDAGTSWREALRRHGLVTLLGSAWGTAVFAANPDFFWWLTPIVVAWLLAIPVSVLTSRVSLGERARRAGLFLTPTETRRPPELRDLDAALARREAARAARPPGEEDGFVRAVVDPFANALHGALEHHRGAHRAPPLRAARRRLLLRALEDGPDALGPDEREHLLADPEHLAALHRELWSAPSHRARRWGRLAHSLAP